MRAKEIIINEDVNLFEINMSPSSLRQLASGIDARAGMEFEMAVPTAKFKRLDLSKADLDYNERTGSIDNIIRFFSENNANSPESLQKLKTQLQNAFQQDVKAELFKIVAEYVEEQNLFDEYAEYKQAEKIIAKNNPNDDIGSRDFIIKVNREVKRRKEEFINNIINEKDPDSELGEIFQDALDNSYRRDPRKDTDRDWLESEGLYWMDHIVENYEIEWPYYKSTVDFNAIGDSYSKAVNKPVNVSDQYHGATRREGQYSLEPDSSIGTEGQDDTGLEFISPPLPLGEMLNDLEKTIAWAKSIGCYTNKSTGLHMNISVAGLGQGLENLDFVKLILLLGDEHILKQFDRLGNYYAKSSMEKLKKSVYSKQQVQRKDIEEFLNFMRFRLQDMASRLISSSAAWRDKYFSVHAKEGYIEFRSPGGDWLNFDIDQLESTLLRFVVALDAAMDPEKYRREYLKKLYKLLEVKNKEDPMLYFAKHAAGELTIEDLRYLIYNLYGTKNYVRMDKKPKLPDSRRREPVPEKRWGVYAPEISPAAARDFVTAPDNYKIIKLFIASDEKSAKFKAKIWLNAIKNTISPGQFAMIGPIEIVPYDK